MGEQINYGISVQYNTAQRGKFGGEWLQVYVWLSPLAVPLKLSQRCSSAILQYKIKI